MITITIHGYTVQLVCTGYPQEQSWQAVLPEFDKGNWGTEAFRLASQLLDCCI